MSTEEHAVAIVEDLSLQRMPTEVLDEARKAASALKDVLDKKDKKVVFNNEQYLEFEDWQTVGKFYGVTAQVESTTHVEYGDVQGFEARANALHQGHIVSSAEAMCLSDERNWKGKPLFQLRSMAQTRACSKALRNCLAWVVVLAGYKPTPAEEMDGVAKSSTTKPPTTKKATPKTIRDRMGELNLTVEEMTNLCDGLTMADWMAKGHSCDELLVLMTTYHEDKQRAEDTRQDESLF